MASISASVGMGGRNHLVDVRALQEAFNSLPGRQSCLIRRLAVDGACGMHTLQAIARFQLHHFGWTDRLVERDGVTIAAINEMLRDGQSHQASRARAWARAELRAQLREYQDALQPGGPHDTLAEARRRDSPVAWLIADSERGVVGHVSQASGNVLVRRSGARDAIPVSGRLDLYPHDRVMTGVNGRVQLTLSDGGSMVLPPESMMIFFGTGPVRRAGTQAELETGALRSRLGELRGNSASANL